MKMNKLFAFMAVASLAVGFTACQKDDPKQDEKPAEPSKEAKLVKFDVTGTATTGEFTITGSMFEKDKVVELVKKKGKTFVKINDYKKMRALIADLLAEIQRIKSEGDYKAGNDLINKYAVKVDPKLHKEVLERIQKLNIPPYRGFVNPKYNVTYDANGNITDITLDYTESYVDQMLRLSRDFSTLK